MCMYITTTVEYVIGQNVGRPFGSKTLYGGCARAYVAMINVLN